MNKRVRCSVVIPTLNRPEAVIDLISDIARQTYESIETIVVDQSDEPLPVLAGRTDITYIHVEEASTTRARNRGAREASGDVIIYFDDDSRIEDDELIEKTMAFFLEHPEYAGVAYTVHDVNARLNRENQYHGKKIMHVTKSGKILPFARGSSEQDVLAPRGGGMAFRKSAIVAVGGFDHRYVGNAMREETDFSLRVAKQIGKIRYKPDCVVQHLGLSSGGSRNKNRMQWYEDFFANEMLFQLTHSRRWYLIHFFIRKIRPILACMFYYGKGRPLALLTPFKGFSHGFKRYKEGFIPYSF